MCITSPFENFAKPRKKTWTIFFHCSFRIMEFCCCCFSIFYALALYKCAFTSNCLFHLVFVISIRQQTITSVVAHLLLLAETTKRKIAFLEGRRGKKLACLNGRRGENVCFLHKGDTHTKCVFFWARCPLLFIHFIIFVANTIVSFHFSTVFFDLFLWLILIRDKLLLLAYSHQPLHLIKFFVVVVWYDFVSYEL